MKIFDPKCQSRLDLFDLKDFSTAESLTLFPYSEEYELSCPIRGRPENVSYFGVSSWGDIVHIHIQLRPLLDDCSRMKARVELNMFLKDCEINSFCVIQEDILRLDELEDGFGNVTKYKVGSFLFEQQRPFTTVRIVFRGFLQDTINRKKVFARIHMFATCFGKVFDNLSEIDLKFMKKQFKDKPILCEDSIEQLTQFKGSFQLEGMPEQREVYFWGLYRKSFETESSMNHFFAWNERGMGVHMMSPKNSTQVYGNINIGMGTNIPLTQMPANFDREMLENVDNLYGAKFTINLKKPLKTHPYELGSRKNFMKISKCLWAFPLKLKSFDGYGLFWKEDFQYAGKISFNISLQAPESLLAIQDNQVLSLEDENAKIEELTGGKGSSLAILNGLSIGSSKSFIVPSALVVTSEAYKAFLEHDLNIKKQVEDFSLKIISCKGQQERIASECQAMQDQIRGCEFPSSIKNLLKSKMESVFGQDFQQKENRYAVRSSAVGEDSQEMSAAGQMTTFLGVSGFDAICQSIIACWASQFGQTAVEYKRGYGQNINSPMGVVIQKMVPSEVAGVMFTCSPLDGNERFITISASYGLGESVVSGQVEPDTYTVKVDVDSDRRKVLCVENVMIGAKKHAIYMNNDQDRNTQTEEVSQTERTSRCLNDEQVLQLARIGLQVHAHYDNARDIEFGLSNGVWYLLQSRPVTNLESLNEWEVMHELDSGHMSEKEVFTRANAGEVFPGAVSYMAFNLMLRVWHVTTFEFTAKAYGQTKDIFNPHFMLSFNSTFNSVFVPLLTPLGLMGRESPTDHSGFVKGFEYGLFGHLQTDTSRFEEIFEKMPDLPTGLRKLKLLYFFKQKVSTSHELNKECYKKFGDYSIQTDDDMTSKQLFDRCIQEIILSLEPNSNHMSVTNTSMLYNAMLYAFLESKIHVKDEQTLLELFSKITSSVNDVFSAQVPARLNKIAPKIQDPAHFLTLSDEESLIYLNKTCPEFVEFLKEYGHRGYKEFDLHVVQWEENPTPLINSLKSILKTNESKIVNEDNDEFDINENKVDRKTDKKKKKKLKKIDHLQEYSLGKFARAFLNKFLIPKVHQGIRDRELGKNLLIRTNHQFRKLFYKLGEKLVEECKLPEKQLIFFMTFTEIREMVNFSPSNPLTILNAKNRLRLHPKKNSFHWNEETIGYDMKPKNFLPKVNLPDGTAKLSGVPVSSGKIMARCCVAETLDDAKNIQKGDILITYSTDIGWSPYFAALSGLVTEIGGLVSHGAVIAREYGLPCLVGVTDATSQFTTGDMLLLDTTSGFVAKMDSLNGNNDQIIQDT